MAEHQVQSRISKTKQHAKQAVKIGPNGILGRLVTGEEYFHLTEEKCVLRDIKADVLEQSVQMRRSERP